MKTALKYLSVLALPIVALTWPLIRVNSTEPVADLLETTSIEKEGELGIGEKIEDAAAREAHRRLQLQDENGQIPADAWINAFQQKEALPFLPEAWCDFTQCGVLGGSEVPDWVSIGPGNIGGRIRSMVIHPNYPNPATIWVGAVSGGVWKTTNGGMSWSTSTDSISHMGVACMAIDPANPIILYAGTGEVFPGTGIYKTTDGGAHWGAPLSGTANFGSIGRLAICPTNSLLILAATSSGLFRSLDGGGNWALVLNVSPSNDVAFQPDGTGPYVPGIRCIAGASNGNAYYSSDGGGTWTAAIWTGGQHAPGRVELGYSRSEPSIVYASVGVLGGQIFRSIDGGHNFSFMGNPYVAIGLYGPNDWANVLWVDPKDSNTVVVGGQYLSRSKNQGIDWEEISSVSTHQDHHAIVEDPRYDGTTNTTVFGCNDGGIYRTDNVLLPCPGGNCLLWTALNHALAITQFYGAAGNAARGTIIGGNQDNGTVRYLGNPEGWDYMRQGDGGYCAADQSSDPYFYGEHIFLTIYRSTSGGSKAQDINAGIADAGNGATANFIAPFVLDPNTPDRMLAGGRRLWRANDVRNAPSQPTWTAIKDPAPANCVGSECSNISAIAVAEGNSNIIWVGYSNGAVYFTTTGTHAAPTWIQRNAGLPSLMCTRITIERGSLPQAQRTDDDPDVPGKPVYVTFGGFSNQGRVWKTESSGDVWTNISSGLPDAPVYSLVISPSNPDILYVGTEVGLFAKLAGRTTWSPSSGGVGHSAVKELFWMGPTLVAATHGRGMFTLSPSSE